MAWFKLAGEGCFHAKVLAAKNDAYGAWCRAGQWSSEHLTEGRIPRAVALTIAPVGVWTRLREAKAGSDHGLVEELADGWQIHDYLDYNDPAPTRTADKVIDGSSPFVYFVRSGSDGAIKIGWTSNTDRRLSELQTGNPIPLTLLCLIRGGLATERRIHQQFAPHRITGEWFFPHGDILAFIDCAKTNGGADGLG